jgi:8-amino-7-oxononanoate synthase
MITIQTAARTFVFSTGLNPPAAAGARKALELAQTTDRPAQLRANAETLRTTLAELGFDVRGSTNVVPVVTGSPHLNDKIAALLRDEGFLVNPIPYPAVPRGTSRIRIIPKATHTDTEIAHLLESMETLGREFDVLSGG